MNNIHAEVDEIFRINNKKAVVSLFLSMQGNHIRAVEAETRLTEARAEIERKDKLIEQMKTVFTEMLEKPRVEVWAWGSRIKELLEETNE